MKKLLLILVVLFSMSANILADGLTATLQQGDVMTPFYGVDAFKDAYAAAQNGAVITLSSGSFNDVDKIEKEISIIGANAFEDNGSDRTLLKSIAVVADNVKIEGIHFLGSIDIGLSSSLKEIHNFLLKRCYVKESLCSKRSHYNTIVDQCVIKREQAMSASNNYCIKNSTIECFNSMNKPTNVAYITNCVVWAFVAYHAIWPYEEMDGFCRPYAIYKNNYLAIYKPNSATKYLTLSSPSEYHNNLFCQSDMDLNNMIISYGVGCVNNGNIVGKQKFEKIKGYPAHPVDAPLGSDGTSVGPYGGTGFSEYPAIPRIISKSIDSNSNAEGKINVKITVKAEQ